MEYQPMDAQTRQMRADRLAMVETVNAERDAAAHLPVSEFSPTDRTEYDRCNADYRGESLADLMGDL